MSASVETISEGFFFAALEDDDARVVRAAVAEAAKESKKKNFARADLIFHADLWLL